MLIMFHFFLHDVVERIFPNEELVQTPYLDAEVLFYPKIVCVYLPWRQAECRNQNQYNRCIWMLVKSGKRRRSSGDTEEGNIVKGQFCSFSGFQMNNNSEPAMFRKRSCAYRQKLSAIIQEPSSTIMHRSNYEHKMLLTLCSSLFANGLFFFAG